MFETKHQSLSIHPEYRELYENKLTLSLRTRQAEMKIIQLRLNFFSVILY